MATPVASPEAPKATSKLERAKKFTPLDFAIAQLIKLENMAPESKKAEAPGIFTIFLSAERYDEARQVYMMDFSTNTNSSETLLRQSSVADWDAEMAGDEEINFPELVLDVIKEKTTKGLKAEAQNIYSSALGAEILERHPDVRTQVEALLN